MNAALDLIEKNDYYFVFMHFIHLHDTVFDKNCKIMKPEIPIQLADVLNIKCINPMIQETVNMINANDPEAIIIVQSDHGQWRTEKAPENHEDFEKQYANFSALYIPKLDPNSAYGQYLSKSPSPVNTFRIIFSHLSKEHQELTKDRFFADDFSTQEISFSPDE